MMFQKNVELELQALELVRKRQGTKSFILLLFLAIIIVVWFSILLLIDIDNSFSKYLTIILYFYFRKEK